jgi:excinuclease ABC subunit C
MASFIKQFYESATYVPRRIVGPVDLPERDLIQSWLEERRGGSVDLVVPQRGEKRRLVQMAAENARESLDQARVKWLADRGKTQTALTQLQDELDLPALPNRIECYDISNIQGTSSVGSMVVFVDGHPRPQEYRRFRIKGVTGANDFASMAEVLRRRFRRARERLVLESGADAPTIEGESELQGKIDESFAALPDLVIIDGGKGQLSAVLDVMRDMGVKHIPTVGLAKQHEEIYVQDVSDPIVLPRASEALYLVQRIRDEAHRFAITYHRGVRARASMQSALDTIPGVGPKRRKALIKKFGSVKGIREASVDEIAATVGFTAALAEKVKAAI